MPLCRYADYASAFITLPPPFDRAAAYAADATLLLLMLRYLCVIFRAAILLAAMRACACAYASC